jgi:hypothetical protein
MQALEEREPAWRISLMQSPPRLRAKSSTFLEFLTVPLLLAVLTFKLLCHNTSSSSCKIIKCISILILGHGGSRAAEYLKEHLFNNLMKHPQFMADTKLAISISYML